MPASSKRKPAGAAQATSRNKVRAHRLRLRAQGLRPVQIWVPDTRSATFARQALRQSKVVAASRHAAADQAFVDAISIGLDA
jgi:hypothetical protein